MYTIKYPRQFLDFLENRLSAAHLDDISFARFLGTLGYPFSEGDDEDMEYTNNTIKYTIAFPGIAPERVQTRLKADRKTIEVIVDGTVQKVFRPALQNLLNQEDLSVSMEHGLVTITVKTLPTESKSQEDVYIPMGTKQFLQESK